jgi:hypothetical protein
LNRELYICSAYSLKCFTKSFNSLTSNNFVGFSKLCATMVCCPPKWPQVNLKHWFGKLMLYTYPKQIDCCDVIR